MVKDSSSRIVQSALRTRFYVLVLLASAYAAKQMGRERLIKSMSRSMESLPAPVAASIKASVDKLQVTAVSLVAKVQDKAFSTNAPEQTPENAGARSLNE